MIVGLAEKKFLFDVLIAIEAIDEHLDEKRVFEEFINNKTKRRAVERELEIIGEAINNLLKLNSSINLSYARTIVDLRNRIIHAYDNVNYTIIWKIIIKDIPVLKEEVTNLLK